MTDQPPQEQMILYRSADDAVRVEVLDELEALWLDRRRTAVLFGVDVGTVNEHLRNIHKSRELSEDATLRKIRIVRTSTRELAQFGIWVAQIQREFVVKGFVLDHVQSKRAPRRKDES